MTKGIVHLRSPAACKRMTCIDPCGLVPACRRRQCWNYNVVSAAILRCVRSTPVRICAYTVAQQEQRQAGCSAAQRQLLQARRR